MKSRTTARFRRALSDLPPEIRTLARRTYEQFKTNPLNPGLRFKLVHPTRPVYSVRVGLHYRALGVVSGEGIVWFWVGSHDEYDRLVSQG